MNIDILAIKVLGLRVKKKKRKKGGIDPVPRRVSLEPLVARWMGDSYLSFREWTTERLFLQFYGSSSYLY